MSTDVVVPTLGESIAEATLGQWLKKPGDPVKADEPIASLETDKVAVEVPSPVAGAMGEQLVAEGQTVAVGALIARIENGAAAQPSGAGAAPPPAASPRLEATDSDPALSPSARRAAIERGVDPSKVEGSGKHGLVTKEDVLAAAAKAPEPSSAPAQAGAQVQTPSGAPASAGAQGVAGHGVVAGAPERREERLRMTRLRQTVARRLKEAQNTAALLTTFNDVDMSAVIDARARYKDLFEKKHGIRLGFMGFFVKAAALAARDVPAVNASIEGEEIVYHDYLDVSVAVSAPNGLVVPVIRDADRLSFAEIEKTIADFGKRAKDGTLKMDEMKGGTFTISNGGVFGSLMSTPIINPPQSAVLGLHRIEDRAVVVNGQIVIRPMMYLALSYDHRLIDGREAVTFLVALKNAIEDPTRILIDL
ncbi:MAG TPA: 2-oxoglutarate dehydrogenase complex dihydrolipoyllysine-residue succinyltransferase [Allosphingosinicella sp.]